ncbi:MAG: hypothetical protein MJY53_01850, partial [Bacteroidales bacterium]|nr:hypothetical protein [Bacteroidales bacterium]
RRWTSHSSGFSGRNSTRMPGSTEYVFLGIQDFDKKYEELETYPEKWLYLMRNTLRLEEVPEDLRSEKCFVEFQLSCGFELSDL